VDFAVRRFDVQTQTLTQRLQQFVNGERLQAMSEALEEADA
jgi:hypothetical protein